MGYAKLQSNIKDLQKNNLVKLQVLLNVVSEAAKLMNAPTDTHDEILHISKEILKHLKNPLMLTSNDMIVKTQGV